MEGAGCLARSPDVSMVSSCSAELSAANAAGQKPVPTPDRPRTFDPARNDAYSPPAKKAPKGERTDEESTNISALLEESTKEQLLDAKVDRENKERAGGSLPLPSTPEEERPPPNAQRGNRAPGSRLFEGEHGTREGAGVLRGEHEEKHQQNQGGGGRGGGKGGGGGGCGVDASTRKTERTPT